MPWWMVSLSLLFPWSLTVYLLVFLLISQTFFESVKSSIDWLLPDVLSGYMLNLTAYYSIHSDMKWEKISLLRVL